MDAEWIVVCETIEGEHWHIGAFEKRLAEQVLSDIRNFRATGAGSRTLRAEVGEIEFTRIDVETLRLEDTETCEVGAD